jgi:hypothetical protein
MKEQDPEKLAKLFQDYKVEYLKGRAGEEAEADAKRKRTTEATMHEKATGSSDPAVYQDMAVGRVERKEIDPWEILVEERPGRKRWADFEDDGNIAEVGWGGDQPGEAGYQDALKEGVETNNEEFAWDDVNDLELKRGEKK